MYLLLAHLNPVYALAYLTICTKNLDFCVAIAQGEHDLDLFFIILILSFWHSMFQESDLYFFWMVNQENCPWLLNIFLSRKEAWVWFKKVISVCEKFLSMKIQLDNIISVLEHFLDLGAISIIYHFWICSSFKVKMWSKK